MTEEPREQKTDGRGQRTEDGDRAAEPLRSPSAARRPQESALGPRPSEDDSPILGIAAHFEPGQQRRVELGMQALASLGVHHVRIEMAWADWHDPHWQDWHQWLIAALSRQFAVLPALVFVPPSSEPATDRTALPENPKAFADFVDALTERFPGTFEWIELPSEPGRPGLWDWRLDPRGSIFSEILASAANRCRQRGIKIVLGRLRVGDLGWLSLMCENGVIDFADAIGLQEDPAAALGVRPSWLETVRQTKRILGEHCRSTALWITGAGRSTDNYDEFAQCEALTGLLNAEVERVYWSHFQDAEPPSAPNGFHENGSRPPLGLLRSDGSPKLLFRLWHSQGIEGVRQFHRYGSHRPLHPHSPRPVLVTGGAGFIGSNLADRLLEAGRPVLILDNLSRPGVEHNVRYLCDTYGDLLEVHVGDVRNRDLVEALVARCESVFHFAAQVAVTTSLVAPRDDFASNLQGTLNVLEAARRQDPMPSLLFTSTNKVYGDLHDVELIPIGKRHVPRDHGIRTCGIGEARPLDFHSPYGCSKGAADQYVLDYARMYGLPGVVFRMSCIYGRRQLGTEDQGWVAHFALQMLREGELFVYGDGRQVRDILYIDDLLDAMFLAMKNIQTVAGTAFNIGGGPDNAVSLLEVIGRLAELSGVEPRIHFGPRRKGDQSYYVSDTRRFSKVTGWEPQVGAARGVPRLYHWLLENVQPGVLEAPDCVTPPPPALIETPSGAAGPQETLRQKE
jgi:CDP-paratose 2-epimerase